MLVARVLIAALTVARLTAIAAVIVGTARAAATATLAAATAKASAPVALVAPGILFSFGGLARGCGQACGFLGEILRQ